MRKRWLIYILLLLVTGSQAAAQEIITGLLRNPQLARAGERSVLKSTKGNDTLVLPFSDDFSRDSLYPSSDRWSDRSVFVNNTFSVNQPSTGIATLDCLDENGMLYEDASTSVFAADRLTSRPVDLAYAPVDSIYLSFLYEAGGIADMPERDDSLTLSFWAPEEEKWYSVWRAKGGTTDGFRRVMIPVKDSRYLKKGFRFMFSGYASLAGILTDPSGSGNADQWNLDHVKLDKNRTVNDTILHDVALTLPLRSLIKGYEALPLQHFRQAYLSLMSPAAGVFYRNNDTVVRNVTRHVSIKDILKNEVVRDFDAGAVNADPMTDLAYEAPLIYTYNPATVDSALFMVSVWLITDDFDPKDNDTTRYLQKFSNYFAIDDGTAEAGYGINGQGSRNAMFALRFRSFIADSVKAISICFNDSYNNANQRTFDIMVWADDNGKPGVPLGSAEGPVASPGPDLNGFTDYLFSKPVSVNDDFWIGWKQLSETFLNAGLDLNTPAEGRQYFMMSGVWEESQAPGIVMIRPVMKGDGSSSSSGSGDLFNDLYRIFPNPTSGQVTLQVSDDAPDDFIIDVLTYSGSKVMTLSRTDRPDLSSLAAGNYLLVIRSCTGKPLSLLRLIKIN
jgi:hypothetical protein